MFSTIGKISSFFLLISLSISPIKLIAQDYKGFNKKIARIIKKHDIPGLSIAIVKDGEIVAEGHNKVTSTNDPTAHAEVVAIREACKKLGSFQLDDCIIYTSCEPCPMCSFMIREYKISRVVFALPSPYMGGYSKWQILQDTDLTKFNLFFGQPPEVTGSFMEDEAKKVMKGTIFWMFGSSPKKP